MDPSLLVGGVDNPETVDMPHAVVCSVSLVMVALALTSTIRPQDTMLAMLRHLKIRSFGLSLQCCLVPEPRSINWVTLPLLPAEQYLADLDFSAFAQRIKDTTETLQTVIVTLKMHRTQPTTVVTLGTDVEYDPDAVERIPLHLMSPTASYPSIHPEPWSR